MLLGEIANLALADAMLAGAGAIHAQARSTSRSRKPCTARRSSTLPASKSGMTWKLPSPTWPTMGASKPVLSISACVSPTQAARAEIGTQTSVVTTSAPGRSPVPPNRRHGAPARAWCALPGAPPSGSPPPSLSRDFGEGFDLLARARRRAVKFEKQRRLLAKREVRIGIAGLDLHLVGKLDAGERQAYLHSGDGGVAGAFDGGEGTDGGEDGLGDAVQLQRELGDDAERSLRADEETGEIVAARRFPGAISVLSSAPSAITALRLKHIIAHGAVAHGIGAGGAGRRHTAEARVGAWVDGEEQAEVAQMIVERFARDAGLDHAVEILRMHGEDAVHARKVERDAAEGRVDVAFERCASAEGDHRHARLGAKLHHLDHLLCGLGKDHRVGRLAFDPSQRVGVLLAERRAGREAIAESAESFANRARFASGNGRSGACASTTLMAALYHPRDSRKAEALGRRRPLRSRRCRSRRQSERSPQPARSRARWHSGTVGAPRDGTPRRRCRARRRAEQERDVLRHRRHQRMPGHDHRPALDEIERGRDAFEIARSEQLDGDADRRHGPHHGEQGKAPTQRPSSSARTACTCRRS